MLEPEDTQNLLETAADRMTLQSEPVRIESGQLLVIDQYMLGNPQFLEGLEKTGNDASTVQDYGGLTLEMIPGTWRVYRFARERAFLLCPESVPENDVLSSADSLVAGNVSQEEVGRVFIETRCVVFLDAELVFSGKITGEFVRLRRLGKDKEARDFLRQNGAAVRYGFDQDFDELRVGVLPPSGYIALTPSVAQTISEVEMPLLSEG